jgi:citronellol/citronellal dehydrogenase
MTLNDKIILITGASRGIGRALALKCAQEGAKAVILAAKTATAHKTLKGTIHSVAEEVEALGTSAFPYQVNLRFEEEIEALRDAVEKKYGKIDILINNASAIDLSSTDTIEMKKFDLMHQVNTRATFLTSKLFLPLLKKSLNPHILTMSPPINFNSPWLDGHTPYILSKYGMTLITLGLSKEFAPFQIKVNSLWPEKVIATAAVAINFPQEVLKVSLKAEIMADAALEIFTNPSIQPYTGQCWIDHDVLKLSGKNYDLKKYEYSDEGALYNEFLQESIAEQIPQKKKNAHIPQSLEELTALYHKLR